MIKALPPASLGTMRCFPDDPIDFAVGSHTTSKTESKFASAVGQVIGIIQLVCRCEEHVRQVDRLGYIGEQSGHDAHRCSCLSEFRKWSKKKAPHHECGA